MKALSFIIFFFLVVLLKSQSIEVIYDSKINRHNIAFSEHADYVLKLNADQALYEPLDRDLIQHMVFSNDLIQLNDRKSLLQLRTRDGSESRIVYPEIIYTDFNDNEVYFQTGSAKIWMVKEPIFEFDWNIVQNSDSVILGFQAQKAIASYRGRVYEAWFTPEITHSFGPWKFSGLPGLILSARSLDGYYSVEAIRLEIKSDIQNIENPYHSMPVTTLEEFKIGLRDFYLNLSKNAAAKNPDGGNYRISFFGDQLEDFGIEPIEFEY